MVAPTLKTTLEEFNIFILQPEHGDKNFEWIGGAVFETLASPISSQIAVYIGGAIGVYLKENPIARLTGADGGYMVMDERYIPDVAISLKAKHPKLATEGYNPFSPDLVVEVISPTDYTKPQVDAFNIKLANYLVAGVQVWAVYPENLQVVVYQPTQPAQIFDIDGVLTAEGILPNFSLPVKSFLQIED